MQTIPIRVISQGIADGATFPRDSTVTDGFGHGITIAAETLIVNVSLNNPFTLAGVPGFVLSMNEPDFVITNAQFLAALAAGGGNDAYFVDIPATGSPGSYSVTFTPLAQFVGGPYGCPWSRLRIVLTGSQTAAGSLTTLV